MKERIYNFSAGPAVLPVEVLEEAKNALISYKNTGLGIAEMSHRGSDFIAIYDEAKANMRSLLGVGEEFDVLFLHGGASLQFYMLPYNLAQGKVVSYINSGFWSGKAITEAQRMSTVKVVASSEDKNFLTLPKVEADKIDKESVYVHFTSNNTIFGTQFESEPESNGVLLACDASSDFLSKPLDMKKYGVIYAGAQKNLGPAGLAVVVIRKDWIEKSLDKLPPMLSYKNHAKNDSMFNTPPTFTLYVVGEVLKWIKKNGGLEAMAKLNEEKANLLYAFMDQSKFYKPCVSKDSRSLMNVTFRLAKEELEPIFVKSATSKGFSGLQGHRSVGGMRASIYNAFPKQGILDLLDFMRKFEKENS